MVGKRQSAKFCAKQLDYIILDIDVYLRKKNRKTGQPPSNTNTLDKWL
jgi:shikimate kinase